MFPKWFRQAFMIVLGLFISLNIFYAMGASGVLAGTSALDFARDFDYQLYEFKDDLGFSVDREGGRVEVVYIDTAPILFRPMCGTYQANGYPMPGADFRKGDWLYTEYPQYSDIDALNLQTGETYDVPGIAKDTTAEIDWSTVEFYLKNGLEINDKYRLKGESVEKEFAMVSTMNESCLIFNAAFYFVFAMLGIIALVYFIRAKKDDPLSHS
jgi:hypothetical protein